MSATANDSSTLLTYDIHNAFLKNTFGIEWRKKPGCHEFVHLVQGQQDRIIGLMTTHQYYKSRPDLSQPHLPHDEMNPYHLVEYDPVKNETRGLTKVNTGLLGYDTRIIVAIGNKIYFFTGFKYYDLDKGKWDSFTSAPHALAISKVGVVDGKLYMVGGEVCTVRSALRYRGILQSGVTMYDPEKDTWTRMPNLPNQRIDVAGVEGIGHNLFVLGGKDPGMELTGKSLVLNTKTRTWTELPVSIPLCQRVSVQVGTKIVMIETASSITSVNGIKRRIHRTHVFDTESNKLVTLPSVVLSKRLNFKPTAALCGDTIYFSTSEGLMTLRLPETACGLRFSHTGLTSIKLPSVTANFSDKGFHTILKNWVEKNDDRKRTIMDQNKDWLNNQRQKHNTSLQKAKDLHDAIGSLIKSYEENQSASMAFLETTMKTIDDKANEQLQRAREIIGSISTATSPRSSNASVARMPVVLTQDEHASDDQPPPDLVCPITFELMEDPVVASDGHTYERKAIEQAIETARQKGEAVRSPMTNEVLPTTMLHSNMIVKRLCQEWNEKQKKCARPSSDDDDDDDMEGGQSARKKRARTSGGIIDDDDCPADDRDEDDDE